MSTIDKVAFNTPITRNESLQNNNKVTDNPLFKELMNQVSANTTNATNNILATNPLFALQTLESSNKNQWIQQASLIIEELEKLQKGLATNTSREQLLMNIKNLISSMGSFQKTRFEESEESDLLNDAILRAKLELAKLNKLK